MASKIMTMYNSLYKRQSLFNGVRDDGIECMFMYELARIDLNDPKNVELIESRLSYYIYIDDQVIQYHGDENKNNPKDTLKSIIEELQYIDISMRQRHRVASFNVQVELIEKSLSSILSNTLKDIYSKLQANHMTAKSSATASECSSSLQSTNSLFNNTETKNSLDVNNIELQKVPSNSGKGAIKH